MDFTVAGHYASAIKSMPFHEIEHLLNQHVTDNRGYIAGLRKQLKLDAKSTSIAPGVIYEHGKPGDARGILEH